MAASRAVVAEAMFKEQTTMFFVWSRFKRNTHAYSCDPAREPYKTIAWICWILNADGTCAWKRSKRDRKLEEFAYANGQEWNFAKLIAVMCAGQ